MARPANDSPFPVYLKYGYWPKDGGPKIARNSTVMLPREEAIGLIKKGVAERADELPE